MQVPARRLSDQIAGVLGEAVKETTGPICVALTLARSRRRLARGEHPAQPLAQACRRTPAPGLQERLRAEQRNADVAAAPLSVLGVQRNARLTCHSGRQVVDPRRFAAGDVPDHIRRRLQRCYDRAYHVRNMDEVAYLVPPAVDQQRPAFKEALAEDSDDAALSIGPLPRSVDVGRTQDGEGDAGLPLPGDRASP